MDNYTKYEWDGIVPWCIKSWEIELTSPNSIFYRYVLTMLPSVGLLLHLAFWACLATRYVPTLVLYRRLLVAVSAMDAVKLGSYLLEATWLIVSNFDFLFVKSKGMGTVGRLLFAVRSLAVFEVVLILIWVGINCNHDTAVYTSGVTGSLLRKLKDRRCIGSLVVVTAIAVSLASLSEIPQREIDGPYCILFPNGDDEEMYLLRSKEMATFRHVTYVIKACVMPTVFVTFICGVCIVIWVKLWRELTTGLRNTFYNSLREVPAVRRSQGQIGVVEDSQNEIRIMVMFVLTPLCLIYCLCWSPHAIINIVNEITGWYGAEKAIKSEVTIWLKTVVELLPSAINPLVFLIAMLQYQSGNPQVPNHQRASRETGETNV